MPVITLDCTSGFMFWSGIFTLTKLIIKRKDHQQRPQNPIRKSRSLLLFQCVEDDF